MVEGEEHGHHKVEAAKPVAPVPAARSRLPIRRRHSLPAAPLLCPAGVYEITVEAWAGGGGGGGRSTSGTGGAGGGGGGAYARATISVTPGQTYNVTVGTGGAGGPAGNNNGTAGGDSYFGNATQVLARGGSGGTGSASGAGGAGGAAGSSIGTFKYSGGTGGTGSTTVSGGGGGGAGNATAGGNASGATAGTGGTAGGGAGAAGRTGSSSGVGSAGSTLGGGGSGAFRSTGGPYAGGSGARGEVRVTYAACVLPAAAFNATPTSGCAPLIVQFTDNSTGSPTGWYWTFGDGGNSTAQNVSHQYSSAGTYTVSLNVTNACGSNTTTQSNYITVYALPTATASSNSPVCEGGTISLTGGPGTGVTYSWTGPNGFTSALQSPTVSTNATLAMAGAYNLTVTNSTTGCVSNPVSTTVVVNPKPTATASSNSPVCEGGTISLTGGPGTGVTYSWTGPNGFNSASQSPTVSTNATLAMAGAYNLTVTNSTTGCVSNPVSTTVVVNPKPTATASSNSPVCEGGTISLTGGPGTGVTYSWTGPNSFTSASQSPTVSTNATLAMAGAYNLTVTNSTTGCVSNPVSTTVVVNPKPTATASSNSPVCEGGTISLTGGPGTGVTYSWTGPNGFNSASQSPTVSTNATLAIAGAYNLTVTNSTTGCSATNSTSVVVNAKPTCHISAAPGTAVCAGHNITLSEDGGDAVSWNWTTAETTSSIVVSASGTYGVTITDGTGCTSYCEIAVTVYALPTCHISAAPGTAVCAGHNITLSEDGGDAVSWNWTTAETTSSIVVSASGTYGVTITDGTGCTSYCEIAVTVYALPTCHISAAPGTAVCAGHNITLSEDGGDAVSWNWTTAETTSSIVVSASGTYGVTITDGTGCTSYCEIAVTVYALPTCHISAAPGTAVCAGHNITLSEDGGDAVSWNWTTAETTSSIVVSASGTYGVTITDGTGCTSYCEIAVTVYALPTCHISAAPGTAVCAGHNITLSEDGGDAVSWNWTTAETTSSIVVSASGTYGVTITDGTGCTSYCEIAVTVYALPTCHISAAPGTAVCAGHNITLSEDGGDAVSWNWTTAETTSSIVVSASGTYGVTITDGTGCTSYCEIAVTVYALPTCHISAAPGTAVCAGHNITLSEDGGDAVSWNWTTAETTSSIVVSASGTYGVTITDGTGCTSYCEIAVTVYALPTCHISAAPGTAVCAGHNITLSEDGGDAVSWNWTTAETTSSIVVSASGTYGVTITDGTGCTSYCEIAVTVYALPIATASCNSPVCEGSTIVLTGGPGGMTNYSWTGPNGFSSSSQSPTIPNAALAMAGNYTLTVTNGGCTSDPVTTSVVVNAKPTATASSNSPVSEGATIELYGGPDGMSSYSWTGPGGWTANTQNATRTGATLAMAGTYTLIVADGGCPGDPVTTNVTLTAVTYTISGTILVGGPPMAGVLVAASSPWTGTAITDAEGKYVLTGVPYGETTIHIIPTLAGYTFDPPTIIITGPLTGPLEGQDFAATAVIAQCDYDGIAPTTYAKIPFAIIQSGFHLVGQILGATGSSLGLPSWITPTLIDDIGSWAGGPLSWSVDMLGWGLGLVGTILDSLADNAWVSPNG